MSRILFNKTGGFRSGNIFSFFSKTGASLSDERVEVYKFYLSPVVFTVRNPSRTMFFEGSKLHLSLIIGVNTNYNWQTNVKIE